MGNVEVGGEDGVAADGGLGSGVPAVCGGLLEPGAGAVVWGVGSVSGGTEADVVSMMKEEGEWNRRFEQRNDV